MDNIFKQIRIPILLTYESETIKKYNSVCKKYQDDFEKEISKHYYDFAKKYKSLPQVCFHLFLLPIEDKAELIEALDSKLKIWQSI